MGLSRRALMAAFGAIGAVGPTKSDDAEIGYGDAYGEAYGGRVQSDCWIATAATGTHSSEVDQLRAFRDETLTQYRAGRWFARVYYRYSPPIARWVGRKEWRKRVVTHAIVRPAAKITNHD